MTDIYALGIFTADDEPSWPGVVQAGKVMPLARLIADAPANLMALLRDWEHWDGAIARAVAKAGDNDWRDEAELIAHLPLMPDNLFGAGANYRKHVIELIVDTGAGDTAHLSPAERRDYAEKEMDERAARGAPFVWVGLRSSIAEPSRRLILPYDVVEPDWEFELAAVIGKTARRVRAGKGLDFVAGYTMANDITARELVTRGDHRNLGMDWLASKGSLGFKVIGPYVTPARFVPDPQTLRIRLSLNGEVMQDEATSDMIFGVGRVIEFISAHAALQSGDIVMTGSPSGNGTHYNRYLRDGDEMRGEIDGLVGVQVVRCSAEDHAAPASNSG